MAGPRLLVCTAAILVVAAHSPARAATAGTLYAINFTSKSFKIVSSSWVDENGKKVVKKLTWTIKPKSRTRLEYKGRALKLKKFSFRIRTDDGTTPKDPKKVWTARYKSGLFLEVNIKSRHLPRSAKPSVDATSGEANGRRTTSESPQRTLYKTAVSSTGRTPGRSGRSRRRSAWE